MRGLIIVLLSIGLVSCDAYEKFNAIVVENVNKQPDSGVAVFRIENPRDFQFTSNDGRVQFSFVVRYPLDEEFLFYKPGYVPVKKKLRHGSSHDTVYLERPHLIF